MSALMSVFSACDVVMVPFPGLGCCSNFWNFTVVGVLLLAAASVLVLSLSLLLLCWFRCAVKNSVILMDWRSGYFYNLLHAQGAY